MMCARRAAQRLVCWATLRRASPHQSYCGTSWAVCDALMLHSLNRTAVMFFYTRLALTCAIVKSGVVLTYRSKVEWAFD